MRANITPKVQVISQKSQVITQKSQVITQNSCHKSLNHTLKYFRYYYYYYYCCCFGENLPRCQVLFTLKITKSILECRLLKSA